MMVMGRTACAGREPLEGQEQPCRWLAEGLRRSCSVGRPEVMEELQFYPDIQHQEGQGDEQSRE